MSSLHGLSSSMLLCCHRKRSHFNNYDSCFSPVSSVCLDGTRRVSRLIISAKTASMHHLEESKERIAKLLNHHHKVDQISVSTYDTAWVAMVPSPHSPKYPCFPDCVKWLLENQCDDGSWARPHHHRLLTKDVLSSTLACILALKKWGVGEQHINRGVHFIESNFASVIDTRQITPMGFDIIFPGMLDYARDLFLNLDLETTALNELIHKRDLDLKRWDQSDDQLAEREGAYLAYIAEGLRRKLQNWKSIMKYQRKNGSLFNFPSTTAAAFIGIQNTGCLNYLYSALTKFGNAVPAVCPLDIYPRLCAVDSLEKLGISKHFVTEIHNVLDETYRHWLQGNEEIFMDASACALAFRLLRVNGYDVTSDQLMEVVYEPSLCRNVKDDIYTSLELYKASELTLSAEESSLEVQGSRLKHLLEQQVSSGLTHSSQLGRKIGLEVNHALQNPFYASVQMVEHRRNIENYSLDNTRVLKTSYWVKINYTIFEK